MDRKLALFLLLSTLAFAQRGQQVILSPYPVAAGVAFVQAALTHQNGATTCVITLTGAANGNLIFVFDAMNTNTLTDTISDGTNTYTSLRAQDIQGANTFYSWFTKNTASTGTRTITITHSGSQFGNCMAMEFSGIGSSPTGHAGTYTDSGGGATGTTWNFPSGVAPSAGDLVIIYGGNMTSNAVATAGACCTIPASNGQVNGSGAFDFQEYSLSAPGGTYPGSGVTVATIAAGTGGGLAEVYITP